MSSQQALIDVVSALFTAEYCTFAAFALVVYDWLINLDEEIRCFWTFRKGGRLNAAVILYGLSRYPIMLLAILLLQTVYPMSDTLSSKSASPNRGKCAVGTLPSRHLSVFSAIRVYAVSPNSKAIVILSFLLLFGPNFGAVVINAMDKAAVLPSPFNCSSVQSPISLGITHR
ncbi:hypothetical protein V8D89_012539 [Ganoderma adspersum]